MKIQSLLSCGKLPRAALTASFLLVWFSGAWAPPVHAGTVTASVAVNAVVLPVATVKTILEPETLTITEEDIRRGFVDGSLPSLVEIRTSSRRGCVLSLESAESAFKEAEVTLQGHTVVVGPQGGMIVLQIFGSQILSVQYRFILARDARPGAYPWPFSFSVSPLE